jgi:hypothetical protein
MLNPGQPRFHFGARQGGSDILPGPGADWHVRVGTGNNPNPAFRNVPFVGNGMINLEDAPQLRSRGSRFEFQGQLGKANFLSYIVKDRFVCFNVSVSLENPPSRAHHIWMTAGEVGGAGLSLSLGPLASRG